MATPRPRSALLLLAAWALLSSGCAGYRLGPTGHQVAGAQSIQFLYFKNETLQPRLPEAFNQALRHTVQQDGTFRLETDGQADIVVTGVIKEYRRIGATFRAEDVTRVQDFVITARVRLTAKERSSGKVILDREVNGRTTIQAAADFAGAERQAIPLLAADLARNATTYLAEGSW